MTPEQYKSLSPNERVVYDEMAAFAKRLSERLGEIIDLLKRAVDGD